MKATSTLAHGALAAVALAAAYVTWKREPEGKAESVVVLDVARKDLEVIRYEDPARVIELRPMERQEGVWVRIAPKAQPDAGTPLDAGEGAPGDGGAVDAGAPPPPAQAEPPREPERELRGNEFAEKLFKRFAPLYASRALGVIEEGKLDELGLNAKLRSIEVRGKGFSERYEVGASGLGLSSPYLRSSRDGKVYLLGGGVVSEFDMGQSRLVDRRLHAFGAGEYDALEVTAGGKRRELVTVKGSTPSASKLAPKAAPETPDDFTKNWHDKVWRSFPVVLLGRGEEPAGTPELRFRIDYSNRGEKIGFLEVSTLRDDFFARTEHTAGWVKLSPGGEGLVIEAARVVSSERQ